MRKPSDSTVLNPADVLLAKVFETAGLQSDEEFAQKMGIQVTMVKGWQNRASIPNEYLRKISEVFDISFDTLIDVRIDH